MFAGACHAGPSTHKHRIHRRSRERPVKYRYRERLASKFKFLLRELPDEFGLRRIEFGEIRFNGPKNLKQGIDLAFQGVEFVDHHDVLFLDQAIIAFEIAFLVAHLVFECLKDLFEFVLQGFGRFQAFLLFMYPKHKFTGR